jgi:hypothetical protein
VSAAEVFVVAVIGWLPSWAEGGVGVIEGSKGGWDVAREVYGQQDGRLCRRRWLSVNALANRTPSERMVRS